MTIWDCQTHVRMTSMTSSVKRTDLDFKISVALLVSDCRFGISPVNYPDPDPERPSQQFFSHVGTEPPLPG